MDVKPEPVEDCIWVLVLSELEVLEQHNDSEADGKWGLDLAALDGLNPNDVINNAANEGDWYFNRELSFDYAYSSPSLLNS